MNAGQFKPGQSGNPAGRKAGSRNKVTLAVQDLLDDDAEKITRAAIDKALEGDGPTLRLCLERLAPARKDGPVNIELPPINTAGDLLEASAAVLGAVASGDLTPDEGGRVMALLAAHKGIVETHDIEERLRILEQEKGK